MQGELMCLQESQTQPLRFEAASMLKIWQELKAGHNRVKWPAEVAQAAQQPRPRVPLLRTYSVLIVLLCEALGHLASGHGT